MKFLLIMILGMVVTSIAIHDAYGCSRDGRIDYVLPWKPIEIEANCNSQLGISWIGLLVWIVMGFLLYNYALALLGKKTMWQGNQTPIQKIRRVNQ